MTQAKNRSPDPRVEGKWRAAHMLTRFDRRSSVGAFASLLRQELLEDSGPNPTATRRLAVDALVFTAANLSRVGVALDGGVAELTLEQAAEARAWLVPLGKLIGQLGFARHKAPPKTLAEIIAAGPSTAPAQRVEAKRAHTSPEAGDLSPRRQRPASG